MTNVRHSRENVKRVTSNITLGVNDNTLILDSQSGAFSVIFPPASDWPRVYVLEFEDITNPITLTPDGADTLDSALIPFQNKSYVVQSDWVSEWKIIGTDNVSVVFQASQTWTTTTWSWTDVIVSWMTLTPWEWNYLAFFNSSCEDTAAGTWIFVSIYANWVQSAESEILKEYPIFIGWGISSPIWSHALITWLGAWQDIDVRWRVTWGTGTIRERTFTLLKIG